MTNVLEMTGITKRFPGVVANDRVDFCLKKGEIHALLGENGAGKSTLMNVLYGLYQPDAGEIRLRGELAKILEPADAIGLGIGMVHQHFMLVPVMTVVENMIIGQETVKWGGFLDLAAATEKIRALSAQYGLDIDPSARVEDLTVGIRQRVEILKALYRNAEILILDEPTAVLTPDETDSLFNTLSAMARLGKSIIFITHKLKEVRRFAHRITVMRGGEKVLEADPGDLSDKHLAEKMVGRDVSLVAEKQPASPGETVVEVRGLTCRDARDLAVVDDVSFEIRAGEILGLAGVQGNGQGELTQCLTGLTRSNRGTVRVDGRDLTHAPPGEVIKAGVSHIPEDRQTHGMVDLFSVADNLVLNAYRKKEFSGHLFIRHKAVRRHAMKIVKAFDIKTPDIYRAAGTLSGGNQQKMVVAREFARKVKFLIAAHPTRGLDVGSAAFIHEKIIRLRNRGCAVLLVSAELDEIFALSDRISVMYKGKIINSAPAEQVDLNTVGMWIAGISEDAA